MNKLITYIGLFLIMLMVVIFHNPMYVKIRQVISGWDNYFYFSNSTLKHLTFNSSSLHQVNKSFYIYLPKGYQAQSTSRYPTLYLLHGSPGNERDWVFNGNIQQTIDQLIKTKKIQPMIVVMPDGNGPIVSDSQYLNADLMDQQMEDYIVIDLVKFIDSNFQTFPNQSKRAIGGSSSGGYGALNIAFQHPDVFSTVFSLSGYTKPADNGATQLLSPSAVDRNSLLSEISSSNTANLPSVYLYYGTNDFFGFGTINDALYQELTKKGVKVNIAVDDGFHDWSSWIHTIEPALIFTNQQFYP